MREDFLVVLQISDGEKKPIFERKKEAFLDICSNI